MNIEDNLFSYLKSKINNFEKTHKRGAALFTCPNIDNHKFKSKSPTATTIQGSDKISCLICGWKGNFYDIVRLLEQDKKPYSDMQIQEYLINSFDTDNLPELEYYKKYGWSLVPVAKNGKNPLEKGWTDKNHYEKIEWLNWIGQGLNIGVRTGESSKITVIDVDLHVSPTSEMEEIYKELNATKTLMQNTPHGKHFIFTYDKDIQHSPKLKELLNATIDIRNDGNQLLISPSKINNNSYHWVNLGSEIKVIPENIKSKLLGLLQVDKSRKSEMSSEMSQIVNTNNDPIILKGDNLEGQCNDTFIQFGGALLKIGIPVDKAQVILHYLNKHWLNQPMPSNVVDSMIGSLEGYKGTEEQTQETAIYEACKLIQTDISAKDIMEHTVLKRAIVDKYLAKLHKEGKLSRRGRGRYDCKTKVEWVNELQEKTNEVNYKIPYFDDVAHFRSGDIVLIGAPTGKGKTTIAINFIKQMRVQGITPFYLSLEAGSRHEKTAKLLGLTQKDYYVPKETVINPLQIEIEPNSFTIIDWLYTGDDFAQTQSVFKHLNDEMVRKGGILIVFTQLKENYDWFAVNLVKSFPRFATRFIYDDETGIVSHFDVCKITDPKGHYQTIIIPTEFNFENKELIKKNNI
jgi:hypothetical protein